MCRLAGVLCVCLLWCHRRVCGALQGSVLVPYFLRWFVVLYDLPEFNRALGVVGQLSGIETCWGF